MKFEKLVILSNLNKSHLGLGEYLRIASFLPNIKYKKVIWYSCNKLKIILKEIEYLKRVEKLKKFNLKKIKNNDLLINLTDDRIIAKNVININDFSPDQKNFKNKTYNLLNLIANKLKIKKFKIFSNKKSNKSKKKIFINWQVPRIWKIKSYPRGNWNYIFNKLKNKKEKKLDYIEWQKKNGNLKYLINQIKSSDLIVSVVSLSCHLAILFNKKLITLSGPNYFEDLKLYSKSKIIFTKKKCPIHKKNLNILVKNCYCMKYINKNEVYKTIINEI